MKQCETCVNTHPHHVEVYLISQEMCYIGGSANAIVAPQLWETFLVANKSQTTFWRGFWRVPKPRVPRPQGPRSSSYVREDGRPRQFAMWLRLTYQGSNLSLVSKNSFTVHNQESISLTKNIAEASLRRIAELFDHLPVVNCALRQ